MKTKPLFSALDRRRAVTIPQLSELTGIPASSLRRWALEGQIPGGLRKGKNRWYFNRADLEQWWGSMQQTQSV
jgi:DNA-binding transcriptional MerR regulator